MVKLKQTPREELWEAMDREHKERMARKITAVRWYVVETTPRYHQHSEYDSGDWIPAKHIIVSPYFDSKEDAEKWMDKREPDKGKSLSIGSQNRRKWTEVHEEWVNY